MTITNFDDTPPLTIDLDFLDGFRWCDLDLNPFTPDSPEALKEMTAAVIFLLTPLIGLAKASTVVVGALGKLGVTGETASAGLARAKDAVGGLSSRLTGGAGALKNFATGTGGSVLALGALAKASYDTAVASNEHLESLGQLDEAQAALIQTLSAAIREEEGILEIRKLSTEQIAEQARQFEEYAQRKIFLTLAIVEATDALRAAEDSGDEAAIKAARERLQNVFNQRKEEQLAHKERTDQIAAETKAQEQGFQAASDAYKQFKTDFDRGVFQSREAALAALQDIAGGLSGESQKNALAEARSLQQEILREKLTALHQSVEAEKTTVAQAQTIQAGLLATYEANLDQRREAAERLADAEEKINDRRLKNEEKLQQQKLDLERSAVQQRIALAQDSPELATLERRLAAGEDVVAQIKREAQEQTNKLKGYLEEEAAIERLALAREKAAAIQADPTNADTINEQAAERLRQLNLQVAAEQAKLDQQLADKRAELDDKRAKLLEKQAKDREAKQKAEADQEAKTAALRLQILEEELAGQEAVFQQRRQHLEALAAAGVDVSAQQKQLAKEEVEAAGEAVKKKLDLKKAEIAARQALEDVAATKEQQALNAKQASLAVDRATREARQELQTIIDQDTEKLKQQTTELEKQLQVLKDQNSEREKAAGFSIDSSFGGVGGIENINTFGGGFGEARQPKEERGPTEQELELQIARNPLRPRPLSPTSSDR